MADNNDTRTDPLDFQAVTPFQAHQMARLAELDRAIGALHDKLGEISVRTLHEDLVTQIESNRALLHQLLVPAAPSRPPVADTVIHAPHPADTLKMIRETLCEAQARIGGSAYGLDRKREHIDRLQRLIDDIDRQRPLGPDGKHGTRHAPTCGCEDKA